MLLESYVPASYLGVTRAAFIQKVQTVSNALGIPAEWLMAVMYVESKLKPWAKNPSSTASGLIQWLDSTARKFGTTADAIRAMNGLQQLDLVQRYFDTYRGQLSTLWDVYFAVHYPAAVGKPDTYVLYRSGSSAYSANKALDVDRDGLVTAANVKSWLWSSLPASARDQLADPAQTAVATAPVKVYPQIKWWVYALIAAGLLLGLYLIYAKVINRAIRRQLKLVTT